MTLSAGIATWQESEDLADLLRRADLALYAAKAAGGDRAEMAPRALTAEAVDALHAA